MANATVHVPVMLREVLELVSKHSCRRIFDATFGGGGYARAFLENIPDCRVWAIDRDISAIQRAKGLLTQHQGRFQAQHLPFGRLNTAFATEPKFDALVFDLGLSSDQLVDGRRGFSFRRAGPLDMRLDQSTELMAADIVNWYSIQQLEQILLEYGEEPFASKIARAIVERRKVTMFADTLDLAALIERQIPARSVYKGPTFVHPATRTFQALRIAVNDELGEIQRGLAHAFARLDHNGVLIVVSFHALEDRLVKDFMRELCAAHTAEPLVLGSKAPRDDEVAANRCSRTAKLRAIKRV